MIAIQAGPALSHRAAPVQTPARPALTAPPHYLRRMARFIVLRAALRGRLGWPAALLVLARLEVL